MTSSYENLRIERDGPVARITLDSTSRMNGLNQQLADELVEAAVETSVDDDVRCIALTGAGDAFCVGADLAELTGDDRDESAIRRLASSLHDAIIQFHQAEKPVVTGINGVAAGAGFGLALVGDLVLVSEDARLEYAYLRIGLVGDGGSTFFLPRLVGLRRAKEIALLDEPIDPDRAVELGLATETVPDGDLDEELADRAADLAAGPTRAQGAVKRLLVESFDRDLAGQLSAETHAIATATRTEDYRRGYRAFFEGEDPEFVGR